MNFDIKQKWATWDLNDNSFNSYNIYPKLMGDFNGDGKADLINFTADGTYVSLSTGNNFVEPQYWSGDFGNKDGEYTFNKYPRAVGDINGDGNDDVIMFGYDKVYSALSTGSSFERVDWPVVHSDGSICYSQIPSGWSSFDTYPRMLADVNGDGKADIIGFASGGVWISLSTGNGFRPAELWYNGYGTHAGGWSSFDTYPRMLADVNGDGKADIIGFSCCNVQNSFSTGKSIVSGSPLLYHFSVSQTWHSQDINPRLVADVNGDKKADVIGFASNGGVYVSLFLNGKYNDPKIWTTDFTSDVWGNFDSSPRLLADVDGDGRADIIALKDNNIYVSLSRDCLSSHLSNGFSVSSSGDGDIVLQVWSPGQNKEEDGNKGIKASIFDHSSDTDPIRSNIIVDDAASKGTRPYAVAIDNNVSKFLVAWDRESSSVSGDHNIYGRQIDKQGNLIGATFIINDPNYSEDCCVALASDGSGNVAAAWLRKTDGAKWHVYMRKVIEGGNLVNESESNKEIAIATEDAVDASNVSITCSGGNLITVWEEGGDIKSASYNGSEVKSHIISEKEGIGKRPSIASLEGGKVLIAWDSGANSEQEANQIYGIIADSYGSAIDQKFHINNNFSKKQCCVHLESDKKGNIIATWLSYEDIHSYNIAVQRFNNKGKKLGYDATNEEKSFSLGLQHRTIKSYQADKVNIANTIYGSEGSNNSILENLSYCNAEEQLVDIVYLGDGGKLVATIESFYLRSQSSKVLENEPEERGELRYNNKKYTTEIKNIENDIKKVNNVPNGLRIVFKKSLGLGTGTKVPVKVIESSLQEMNIGLVENSIEAPEDMVWKNQGRTDGTLSVVSDFKQELLAQSSNIIIAPMTCKNIKIVIKKVKEILIASTMKAEISGYSVLENGNTVLYDQSKIKTYMEQRIASGVEIIELSDNKKVIAKADSELSFQYYEITINDSFIEYCGKEIDQQNYAMLYKKKKGFAPMNNPKNIKGEIDLGVSGKWCNIHALRVGDFNGDGKSDLFCNLMDGTNKMMLSDGIKFINPNWGLDNDGTVKIAGFNKWCSLEAEDGYLYLGDFNKDGKTDFLCHDKIQSKVMLSDADGFTAPSNIADGLIDIYFCYKGRLLIGSFSQEKGENSKSDLLCQSNTFGMTIMTSNQDKKKGFIGFEDYNDGNPVGFGRGRLEWCKDAGSKLLTGDFNGDGKSDLLCNVNGKNYIMFFKQSSDINLFTAGSSPNGGDQMGYISVSKELNWCKEEDYMSVGDFDGDGKDDLYCNQDGKNMIMKAVSTADDVLRNHISFESISLQHNDGEVDINNLDMWCKSQDIILGNFNNDGYMDLLCNGDNNINI